MASLATAAWLGYRRHWIELTVLVVGVIAILLGTIAIKDLIDRPRPPFPLVDAGRSSFPSGHASHSVIYAWIALTVSIRSRAGVSRGTAIVMVGVAAAAAIGLSRVYLRVHYLSDVAGGWAYGVSVFALLSAAAVLVGYFRQDEHRDD